MPTRLVNGPKETLAKLVKRALDAKGWSPDVAAAYAKERGLGRGFSARNIREYRDGGRKLPPKDSIIRRFAQLVGQSEDSWVAQFPGSGLEPPLLDRDSIIRDQEQLSEGDEVSVISSRAFLETEDAGVVNVVLRNLDRGIIYKYYFASGSSHPYGQAAAESYKRFREEHVVRHGFSKPPLVFGYAVDPTRFRFFSDLHTIVLYRWRASISVSKAYAYIEVARGESGQVEQLWYPLPDNMARQIAKNLNDARSLVADAELPVVPLNPCLPGVASDYVKWFQHDDSAARYTDLRPVLGHGNRCVQALMREIARKPIEGTAVKYLDVGCGDGVVMCEVAKCVARHYNVSAVGLDASQSQLRLAKVTFQDVKDISFSLHEGTFETFQEPQGSFQLVTAIHSLYTIDESYVRRIYELLAPGGIAYIWMAMRQSNVVTSVCDAVDSVLRPGQRRNSAEDVERFANCAGLSPKLTAFPGVVPRLMDSTGKPTANGQKLIDFCSLQPTAKGTKEWEAAVGALRDSGGSDSPNSSGHPLTDGLVAIRRYR